MKGIIKIIVLIVFPIFAGSFIIIWHHYYGHKIFYESKEFFVTHDNYQDFISDLDSLISIGCFSSPVNRFTLHYFTKQKRLQRWFDKGVVNGRYVFDTHTTINELVNKLRGGDRDPVDIIFNSANSPEDAFGVISSQLQLDSIDLINYIDASNINIDKLCLIPETYNLYWNISVDDFFDKMTEEYDKFWNNERMWAAGQVKLKPFEVFILASIIEKETQHIDEMNAIAGVYLNRLNGWTKSGVMRLQADPTINYCRIKSGKARKNRIYIKNINEEFDCLHNTYHHDGLPPSPICVPSTQAIDAVLNPEKHQFLYFCAKPGWDGYHNFAQNQRQHQKNQKKWTKWLNEQGIK